MLWEAVRRGLFDELQKIGAVSLSGLSPETLLNQKPPEPLETPGSKKAIEIIDRAATKTAALSSPAQQLRATQKVGRPVVNRAKNGPNIKQQIRGTLTGLKGTLPPP